MTDLSPCRLWLNWEAFEVASINPLFTADISLDKIRQFAAKFENVTKLISFEEWKTSISGLFRLNENQIQSIYATLTCFLTKDPQQALMQSCVYLSNSACPPSFTIRVTDMLVYLFAIFVKKKFRAVSELSNMEAFPGKKPEERLSPHARKMSASTPTVSARLVVSAPKNETSHVQLMQRFLLSKLPDFLSIYAKDGLTRAHVQSFSFLVCGGPSYAYRADNLITALNLFQQGDIEDTYRFQHAIQTLLPIPKETEAFAARNETTQTSPLAYRPLFPRALSEPAPPESSKISIDKPKLIEDKADQYIQETPSEPCNFHIHNCRHTTIYICGVANTVFISHCKGSTIFVGSATAIHLEYCLNVRVIVATKMIHFESCTRCLGYLLTNTRPLITGNSTRLTLAPYNAMYQKFGIDTLTAGINPKLNMWDQPIILGSLGSSLFEKLKPELFRLFVVPFTWATANPIVNAIIPFEYEEALEAKRTQIMNLKRAFDVIGEKSPDLYEKLLDRLKSASSKWIESEGYMNDIKWLYEVQSYGAE